MGSGCEPLIKKEISLNFEVMSYEGLGEQAGKMTIDLFGASGLLTVEIHPDEFSKLVVDARVKRFIDAKSLKVATSVLSKGIVR